MKFNHLYSDWVKKQIGCNDENIEFEFGENKEGARLIEHMSINFNNIQDIENVNDQIFKNIDGYYLKGICIKNCNINNKKSAIEISKSYETEYKNKINNYNSKLLLDKFYVKLYFYDVDLVNDKSIRRNGEKDDFFYFLYDYKNKVITYYSNEYDNSDIADLVILNSGKAKTIAYE